MNKRKVNNKNDQSKKLISKHTIYIPFDVMKIKCKNCGVEFALLALVNDNDYWLQGNESSELYCPYCGKKI